VRELAELGVRDVGENRHQEAMAKSAEVDDSRLSWHFVGQLQTNKARAVRRYAATVHSVDRASLVDALAADDGAVLGVFLEIGLSDDPGRGGIAPDAVVMGVAPLGAEPRQAFARLRTVAERVRRLDAGATAISAGMSGDFREAILEGATHLRIGTAITGNRPIPG
jgi:uncharacterized pyridoxal phosphate-containing UPF0001 family protein